MQHILPVDPDVRVPVRSGVRVEEVHAVEQLVLDGAGHRARRVGAQVDLVSEKTVCVCWPLFGGVSVCVCDGPCSLFSVQSDFLVCVCF